MIPVYINDCFGILHPAMGRHGVLICSSMGDEAMNVYRPLVFLAEQFADAGCPVLRLDYYGAGDSGGEDGGPGRFQAWLDEIVAGVRWLRLACGIQSVTLVGARIGALLAARAACELKDVDGLILLNPVQSGRRFLREMMLRARNIADIWQVDSRIEDGNWFEAYGMRLDLATRDALDRLDIARLRSCPAPRALVLDQPDSPAGATLSDQLERLGSDVTYETADALRDMLRDPYENCVPHEAFARAIAWHQAGAALHAEPMALIAPDAIIVRDTLLTGTGVETPVRFGPDQGLFGILSTPAHPRGDVPPVLIANTGANPHAGNSRMAVTVTRWLAANGIASLRMDGAGIGDAALETGERGQPYASQGDLDLTAGIDELTRRFGSPVLVLGMCSGAFHALRAAYDDQRICGLMLVNLQKFAWHDGEALSVVQRGTFRNTSFYLRNVVSRSVWMRLLQGEVNVLGISRQLAERAWRRGLAASDPALSLLRRQETQVGRVRRRMHELAQRQVPILYVLSGNDPGREEIAEYFGNHGHKLQRQRNIMFRTLEGADHTLSAHWAREALLALMACFLRQRCGLAVQADRPIKPPPARIVSTGLDVTFGSAVVMDTPGGAA